MGGSVVSFGNPLGPVAASGASACPAGLGHAFDLPIRISHHQVYIQGMSGMSGMSGATEDIASRRTGRGMEREA
ncbi:hypothetical protein GQ53DRAFT_754821 [Thozetella sp. PMI_491]|nr:hypothetical protein GQ53DRAFT_754821 [Thozetella sp. PMI_491]